MSNLACRAKPRAERISVRCGRMVGMLKGMADPVNVQPSGEDKTARGDRSEGKFLRAVTHESFRCEEPGFTSAMSRATVRRISSVVSNPPLTNSRMRPV